MDPLTLSALATLVSGLFGGLMGGGGQRVTPEQRRLMGAQTGLVGAQTGLTGAQTGLVGQQTRGSEIDNAMNAIMLSRRESPGQDALFRALSQMAFQQLPAFAQQGINFDVSQPTAPSQSIAPSAPAPDQLRPRPPASRPREDRPSQGTARNRFF